MTDPLQLSLNRHDGTTRRVIIEPVLQRDETGLYNTGVYKIFKDALGDESALFTEPLEKNKTNNDLPDDSNPDYLGELIFDGLSHWRYHGELLTLNEQKQVATYIMRY
ncbi:MAG TPA: hypothetical protein VHA56_17225 [Mucilaginibacter sp.]|nr:hypothetical protein [Mucilaginibacter sp.]